MEAVCQVVAQTGVLTGGGRRVLDSTVVENAVATQDTVRQLVAAVRRVRVAAVNLRRLLVLGLARHDGAWVLA